MPHFNWAPLLAAVAILRAHEVKMCLGGEVAFAYYNALDIEYAEDEDPVFEIIVPEGLYIEAVAALRSSGRFASALPSGPSGTQFDQGWRERNQFVHFRTTGWSTSPSPVAIVPDSRAGINLDWDDTLVDFSGIGDFNHNPYLDGLGPNVIKFLPWPRLPTLVRSMPWRMGQMDDDMNNDTSDDDDTVYESRREMAKEQVCTAVAKLVDGTNISSEWAYTHLGVQNPALCELVRRMISTKLQRMNDFDFHIFHLTPVFAGSERDGVIRPVPGRD